MRFRIPNSRSSKPLVTRNGSRLSIEALERRELLSASPLPVLMVIADQRDFYYKEYSDTRLSLESRGIGVVVAASTLSPSTPHWNSGQAPGTAGTIVPDITLSEADPADYSAIAFVGGWGSSMYQYAYNDPNGDGTTDNYYSDGHYNGDPDLNDGVIGAGKAAANNLINDFLESDKPVAAICHGVTVLAWARVDGVSPLAGKQVTVPRTVGSPDQQYAGAWRNNGYYSGQYDQVVANGGIAPVQSGAVGNPSTVADDVIVDGCIITGENYDSAWYFGTRIADEVIANVPEENHPPVVANATWLLAENSSSGTLVGTVQASDSDAGQSLTYALVNGNVGGAFAIHPLTGAITVANAAALDFETNSTFHLVVQVTDNGQEPRDATGTITIQLQDVSEGPVVRVGNDLVVQGTPGNDTIYLWSGAGNVQFAWLNGTSYGPFALAPGGRVRVYAGDGNDQVFATDLAICSELYGEGGHDLMTGGPANDLLDGGTGMDRLWGSAGDDFLRGGDGNDHLSGREGNDVLLGGVGDDTLEGFDGQDLLIGGLGSDCLKGQAGSDLLIGGTTTYDNDVNTLKKLRCGWTASADLDSRIVGLTQATGPRLRLNDTVFDDGAVDVLAGGTEADWFLAQGFDWVWSLEANDRHTSV